MYQISMPPEPRESNTPGIFERFAIKMVTFLDSILPVTDEFIDSENQTVSRQSTNTTLLPIPTPICEQETTERAMLFHLHLRLIAMIMVAETLDGNPIKSKTPHKKLKPMDPYALADRIQFLGKGEENARHGAFAYAEKSHGLEFCMLLTQAFIEINGIKARERRELIQVRAQVDRSIGITQEARAFISLQIMAAANQLFISYQTGAKKLLDEARADVCAIKRDALSIELSNVEHIALSSRRELSGFHLKERAHFFARCKSVTKVALEAVIPPDEQETLRIMEKDDRALALHRQEVRETAETFTLI